MSGVQEESTAIWLAAVTAAVNFIFTFVGLYLVERIGRRRLTLGSLAGLYLTVLFYGSNGVQIFVRGWGGQYIVGILRSWAKIGRIENGRGVSSQQPRP